MKKVTSSAAKMTVKDEWVAAAMTDDQIVVELLLRLKHAGTVVAENPATNLPPLRWGIRQRRSRSSRFGGGGGVLVTLKKDVDSARGSPKTPLSWSGGSGSGGGSASPSAATADGFEDTSRQASCSTSTGSGSKVFSLSLPKPIVIQLPRLDLVFSPSPFFSIANSAAAERCKSFNLAGFSVTIWPVNQISPSVACS